MKVEIIPAILPKDFAEVVDKTALVTGLAKTVQIDVCDGQFVPSSTWPYRKADDSFERIIHEEEGLPGWKDLNFEIDMMVNRAEDKVEDWIQAGAMRLIIHIESKTDLAKVFEIAGDRIEIGLAINIETPIENVRPYADKISFVQCMGIDRIGFQHQPFDRKVDHVIRDIRAAFPQLAISVDGGVTLETGPELIAAGANRLVVGHAIFESDNLVETFHQFRSL